MIALVYALAADAMERRARRLAKYARYRASEKGKERTLNYNASPAHLLACRRWRESHTRSEGSYQTSSGRWVNLLKVDPGDKGEAERQFPTLGGVSHAGRMLMGMGFSPDVATDEEAWNRAHAHASKPFSSDEARKFWTRKHQHAGGER